MITGLPTILLSSECPIGLGSPLRVPSHAWRNWGISWETEAEYARLITLGEEEYRKEWKTTTEHSHHDIARAANLAGLGDANSRLNAACAGLVAKEVQAQKRELRILDVGAGTGNTSLAVFAATSHLHHPQVTLLDYAKSALDQASESLTASGLVPNRDFSVCLGQDMQAETLFGKDCFDIVIAVAALHHHSDILVGLGPIAAALKPGGLVIVGDWHNTMWENPARVHALLRQLGDWPQKNQDIEQFGATLHPDQCLLQENDSVMERANGYITEFWKAYALSRTVSAPRLLVLEGHRSPAAYRAALSACSISVDPRMLRLDLPTNPFLLTPESSVLGITVGRKAGETLFTCSP